MVNNKHGGTISFSLSTAIINFSALNTLILCPAKAWIGCGKTFNSAVPSFIFVVFVMYNTSTGDAQLTTDMVRGSASILEAKRYFVEDDENTHQSGSASDTLLITEMENGGMQARVKIVSPFNCSKIVTSHGVGTRTSNTRLLAEDSNDVRCTNTRLEMPSCTSCMV